MGTVKLKDFRSAVLASQTEALAKLRDISMGKLHETYWHAYEQQLREAGRLLQAIDANPDADIASLSAPQPPAEAHCATCSCVPGMTPAVRFDTTPAEREGAVRDHLIRMGWTPPSAPVGVDGAMVERAWEAAMEIKHNKEPWFPMTKRRMKRALSAALAQQPAAAGEEIMVNAAHDVYTLPLQPSGLSSGPRFVVHVPAPEQPAAVDDLTNAWRAAFVEERATRYREGGMKIEQARIHAETDAARIAALAAQQQGGSDDA